MCVEVYVYPSNYSKAFAYIFRPEEKESMALSQTLDDGTPVKEQNEIERYKAAKLVTSHPHTLMLQAIHSFKRFIWICG